MKTNQIIIFSVFIFIFLCNKLIAQDVITIKNDKLIIDISQLIYYFEDEENKLNIQDIQKKELQSKFVKNTNEIIFLDYNNNNVWVKFTLKNTLKEDIYLEVKEPYISLVEVFIPKESNGNFAVKKLGSSLPASNKEIASNYFITKLLSSSDTSVTTFYICFHHEGHRKITLNVSTLPNFYSEDYYTNLFYGAFLGLIFIMSFYNLFIYIFAKENVYLYYVLSTLTGGLANVIISGYAFDIFWANYPQLNLFIDVYLSGVPIIFFIIFSCSFLETYKYTPKGHTGIVVICVMIITNLFVSMVYEKTSELIAQSLTVVICIYLFIIAVYIYQKGNKIARFYIMADGFLLLGIIIYVLKVLRFIPANFITNNSTLFGTVFDTLFFSIAMGDKINILNQEKHEAQLKNIELIQNQKENLEVEVHKRTIELEEKTAEVITQNEELQQQQEELLMINKYLEESQLKVKEQNIELAQKQVKMLAQNEKLFQQRKEIEMLKNDLEDIVKQRTKELRNTLDNLTKQNQDLEQFSYIISHNLRAPVARILGLMNLLNENGSNEIFNKEILNHLRKSTIDLDTVIKDLSQIISIRKDLNKTKEEINILAVIRQQQFLLQDEIKKSNANINTKLVSIKNINTIKSYFQSILYNLLSNAIKYKSNERSPLITIKTEEVNQFICLSVQDNGIGIDLTNVDTYKIFGLYQRMHDHVEGKGLGLFLVKTQIESLGGRIEVESELNVGTTFKVYFPM